MNETIDKMGSTGQLMVFNRAFIDAEADPDRPIFRLYSRPKGGHAGGVGKGGQRMPISVAIVGYLFAIGAGVCFVFQQAVNANLRAEIDSPGGRALSAISAGRSSCSSSRLRSGSPGCPGKRLNVAT